MWLLGGTVMATEVNLKPGWLSRDARRAANRVQEWSVPQAAPMTKEQDSAESKVHSADQPKKAETDRNQI
jgi:hypothetical protein